MNLFAVIWIWLLYVQCYVIDCCVSQVFTLLLLLAFKGHKTHSAPWPSSGHETEVRRCVAFFEWRLCALWLALLIFVAADSRRTGRDGSREIWWGRRRFLGDTSTLGGQGSRVRNELQQCITHCCSTHSHCLLQRSHSVKYLADKWHPTCVITLRQVIGMCQSNCGEACRCGALCEQQWPDMLAYCCNPRQCAPYSVLTFKEGRSSCKGIWSFTEYCCWCRGCLYRIWTNWLRCIMRWMGNIGNWQICWRLLSEWNTIQTIKF